MTADHWGRCKCVVMLRSLLFGPAKPQNALKTAPVGVAQAVKNDRCPKAPGCVTPQDSSGDAIDPPQTPQLPRVCTCTIRLVQSGQSDVQGEWCAMEMMRSQACTVCNVQSAQCSEGIAQCAECRVPCDICRVRSKHGRSARCNVQTVRCVVWAVLECNVHCASTLPTPSYLMPRLEKVRWGLEV